MKSPLLQLSSLSSWSRCATALLLAFTALATQAQLRDEIRSRGFTEGEWALLPEWCIDSQQGPYGSPEGAAGMNKSPRAPQWVALMGTDFWAMHHYCRGLVDLHRLNRSDISARERAWLVDSAIDEFRYVIRNCKPTMPLLPEVFLRQGDVLVVKGDLPAASAAFEQSRKLKPDYWPAYARWADVLIGLKQHDRARALVEEGLAHSPQQPTLLQKFRQAGGTQRAAAALAVAPVPAPAPAAAAASAPAPAPAPAPATTAAVAQPAASSPP